MNADGAMTVVVEYEQASATIGTQVLDLTAKMPRTTMTVIRTAT